jgi:molecular chaperone GrpE (heat shock protein)
MYDTKFYYETVIKTFVEKLALKESELESAGEDKKRLRKQVDELTSTNASLAAEIENIKKEYKI